MADIPFANGTQIGRFDRCDRHRVTGERGEFHFVGNSVAVDMHHRPRVACFQIFSRQVLGQLLGVGC